MKNTKKYLAVLLALVLVLAMGITALAATVTVPEGNTHSYAAYQIFTGTQAAGENGQEGELGNVEWGSGINSGEFLTALKGAGETAFANGTVNTEGYVANVFSACNTAQDVAEALGQFADDSAAAERFAKLALANKTGNGTTIAAAATSVDLADGYYLIVDTANVQGEDDVANPALLQLTGTIAITSKTDKPTVDKQVLDEVADAETGHTNGWGETADHELNESFQFKLIANLPADIQFDRYTAYEAKFTDIWAEGVTYEDLESIKVDGVTIYQKAHEGVTAVNQSTLYTQTVVTTNRTMVIDIPNIKSITGVTLSDGATIEVIYNAHLNENAIVANAATIANETADDNQNKVYLEYSNKPDATGLGKTPEDIVYVFTYETVNTKFAGEPEDNRSNVLAGAGFKLYKMVGETKLWAVLDENYKITGWTEKEKLEDGDPEGTIVASEVTSDTQGKFSFIGLDAGTYYLKESSTPAGYNTIADITVTISATHEENSDCTSAKVQKNGSVSDPTFMTDVVNNMGTTLPETGGIGTTIFYVIGGLLMICAVVFLVTKKKISSGKN